MKRNTLLVIESIIVFALNGLIAVLIFDRLDNRVLRISLYIPLLLFQGLWLYRLYIVGHEASHKKLFSGKPLLNDMVGTLMLMPLLVPINIFRKIHYFHHGFNRKDNHTSALDTFVVKSEPGLLRKVWYYILWYISVFFGGFFIHSLVSVFLFLFVPPSLAVRISPAFKGWKLTDQLKSIGLFGLGIAFHAALYIVFGKHNYLLILGFPFLSFAWVLSLLLYIFHYDTSIGKNVRFNARSVNRVAVISWILMNFNEHATHHQYPNIPWYELPKSSKELPDGYREKNQNTRNFFRAVFNQIKGPRRVHEQ